MSVYVGATPLSSSQPKVEIRGIYATALTKILSSHFRIVRMSKVISKRFNTKTCYEFGEVLIRDNPDKHGVTVLGTVEGAEAVVNVLKNILPDVIVREKSLRGWFGYGCFNLEFPYLSKRVLDKIRGEVVPTIPNHHKFRIFASNLVDEAENELLTIPERDKELEEKLKSFISFKIGEKFEINHVKPSGKTLKLKGEIFEAINNQILKVKRSFKGKGFYDGLKIMKEDGDYGVTEIVEGAWITKHSYFSCEGFLKGEFYNINTPTELYPSQARYIDLEVDVVKPLNKETEIIDLDVLEKSVDEGFISQKLADAAKEVAEKLAKTLKTEGNQDFYSLTQQVKPKLEYECLSF